MGFIREKFSPKRGKTSTPPYNSAPANSSTPSEPPPPYVRTEDSLNKPIGDDDKDLYGFLTQFDTVFLVDDSGSMAGSRWSAVAAALQAITPVCTARDPDGIDLYFLNHRSEMTANHKASGGFYDVSSPSTITDIFRTVKPSGRTPTGVRLQQILKPYIDQLERNMDAVRPMNIIVITDGSPTDDPEGVLVQNARRLDLMNAPGFQVGVQFFQIGKDREAKDALRDLDDGLAQQGIRDMVDAVTWDDDARGNGLELTPTGILKVVLGAVNRRVDRSDKSKRRA